MVAPIRANAQQPNKVGSEFMGTLAWPVGKAYYDMQGQVGAAQAAAQGQIGAAKAAASGQIGAAGAAGQGQATTGLGNAYSDAYGAYSSGLGNVAQARAADRTNFYNANALAEQARQNALGTMGSASLGAYGSAANSALGAWAANQTAYNKAVADMQAANQAAMSGYGSSRNAALGQYSTALGGMGTGLGNATRAEQGSVSMPSSFGGGFGSGGFDATGYGGSQVAFGSYGGMGGGGGMLGGMTGTKTSGAGPQFGAVASNAFGGMNNALAGIMDPGVIDSMNFGSMAGRGQLDTQHYTSRGMPSMMLDQTLGGLAGLSGMNINALQGGMDQYYATATDPRNRARFGDVLQNLGAGYNTATGGLNALSRSIPGVMTPLQQAQEANAATQFNNQMRPQPQMTGTLRPVPSGQALSGPPRGSPRPAPAPAPAAPQLRGRDAAVEAARLTAQYNQLRNSLSGSYSNTSARDLAARADAQWQMQSLADRIRELRGMEPISRVS